MRIFAVGDPARAAERLTGFETRNRARRACLRVGRRTLILDAEINPAVAAHRGHVSLVDVTEGRVQLRLEGGCQGCNLAQVTLRQGIEPMLRERLAEVVSVVDVTNHAEGGEPFYSPAKR